MKLFFAIIILFLLNHCSFDKRTGIWKNENNINIDKDNDDVSIQNFKSFKSSKELFYEIIPANDKIIFDTKRPIKNSNWPDVFYKNNNNFDNYSFKSLNKIALKTKKLTKYKTNNFILYENNNLIINDHKGNIVLYSFEKDFKIKKFNFYKNKYKKIKKILNFAVENEIIFVSDNLGYVYAYNYILDEVLWAKNYKIPFRSNMKVFNDKLITSNQNNELYILDKFSGNLIKLIPSEDTTVKKLFINNISLSKESIFFLNTYGSLYSIDINDYKLNWIINLNNTLELNLNNIFLGTEVVNYKDKVLVSSNENFFILESKNGSIVSKKNFSLACMPTINKDYVFLITKNNLLIAMDIEKGDIIYSLDIDKSIANFLNSKKYQIKVKKMMLVNNNIYIFLTNSYLVKLSIKGGIEDLLKLPSNLESDPIFVNNSLLYLDKKNRLFKLN
mgnify:CR=1 FL=1